MPFSPRQRCIEIMQNNATDSKYLKLKTQLSLHAMMVPGILLALVFSIVPLAGIIMAFEKYDPAKGIFGSQWVDIYNFKLLFGRDDFLATTRNTVVIALWKIVLNSSLSILLALLINEIQHKTLKKSIQTIIFLPYFLSWVLLGNIMVEMFSTTGSVNLLLEKFGVEANSWITSNKYFRPIVIVTDVWKTVGYQVVVFLAAITGIDPSLYEAGKIDGASNTRLCLHITIPGIMSMIVLTCILNIGNIMNAGFEQILVMYNPSVYATGDILDTMSYRLGLTDLNFSMGTAIGLFKSVISCAFFAASYYIAYKVKDYRIF